MIILKKVYSIPETVEITGICKTNIYKAIKEGKLIAKKYGSRTLIPSSSIEAFIESLPAISSSEGK